MGNQWFEISPDGPFRYRGLSEAGLCLTTVTYDAVGPTTVTWAVLRRPLPSDIPPAPSVPPASNSAAPAPALQPGERPAQDCPLGAGAARGEAPTLKAAFNYQAAPEDGAPNGEPVAPPPATGIEASDAPQERPAATRVGDPAVGRAEPLPERVCRLVRAAGPEGLVHRELRHKLAKVPKSVVRNVVAALVAAGLIRQTRTSRGTYYHWVGETRGSDV